MARFNTVLFLATHLLAMISKVPRLNTVIFLATPPLPPPLARISKVLKSNTILFLAASPWLHPDPPGYTWNSWLPGPSWLHPDPPGYTWPPPWLPYTNWRMPPLTHMYYIFIYISIIKK